MSEPQEQAPSRIPTPKIAGTTIAGAAAVILVWVLGLFGVNMPDPVAAAAAVLIAAVVGYLTPER